MTALPSQVLGRRNSWSLGGDVGLGHASIDDKVGRIDEAALVAGEEDDGLGLLDGLSETASGKVHFTSVALGLVVTKPVLEERSAVNG